MEKKYIIIIFVLSLMFLMACGEKQSNNTSKAPTYKLINGKPEWVWKPSIEGKLGGVGISGIHYKGVSSQRSLAISRAIDEIARQKGVKVDTVVEREAKVVNGTSSTNMQIYSKQYTNGQKVSAKLLEMWIDLSTNEIYVWMCE